MIPLKDYNPTKSPAIVTILLIAACTAIYFLVQPVGHQTIAGSTQDQSQKDVLFTLEHAAIPCEVVHDRPLSVDEVNATFGARSDSRACESHPASPPAFPHKQVLFAVVYSMFLHGSLLHLGGNMLFLWVFGNNIEDIQGKAAYLAFYLIGGLVATSAHILVQPDSTVPVVGASGAIAAVMGAYLVIYPRVRIRTLFIFFFILFRDIEARWLLALWFLSQFIINPNAGVAWVAHVGGFLFGALAGMLWRGRARRDPAYAY